MTMTSISGARSRSQERSSSPLTSGMRTSVITMAGAILVQRAHRAFGAFHGGRLIAEHRELSLEALADAAVVVDHEDAMRHAAGIGSDTMNAAPRYPSAARVTGDVAAVIARGAQREGEPEPRAVVTRRVERAKDVVSLVDGDAGTVVGDGDVDPLPSVVATRDRRDADAPALRLRLRRVDQKIHEHPGEELGIADQLEPTRECRCRSTTTLRCSSWARSAASE